MARLPLPQPDPVVDGQESVWDYPRPPALDASSREITVMLHGVVVGRTSRALRVLETSHPPTYYLPPDDVDGDLLVPAAGSSFCEWKGSATYWTVTAGGASVVGQAWSYRRPSTSFAPLADHLSFYPAHFDCFVDGERVRPQPGEFYGGWITDDVRGPFKGVPGSMWW